jgi:hypothetical protein
VTAAPREPPALETAVAQLLHELADPDAVARAEPRLVQQLLAAAVCLYASKVNRDGWLAPFAEAPVPTASEVCLASVEMLEAASVEIFELALWKSWAHSAAQPSAAASPPEALDERGGAV